MTNENQSVKNMISGSSTKQKVVTIATIIVFIVIIWQVMGLFGNKVPTTPVATKPVITTKQMSSTGPGAQMNPSAVGASAPTQMPTVPIITTTKETSSLLKDQESEQKNYLDSINQLQMLKVKREIAETNQAISSARLATATADKSMSDLLTAPAVPAIETPGFTTRIDSTQATGSPPPPFEAPVKSAPVVIEAAYSVISVSMQFQRWTAVLGLDGKLYSVGIGDTLVDGSSVVSISRTGVVLEKANKRRKISIVSSI
ncbi:MAG: hypothetical protein ABI597_02255 [Gammaproteobacteria bacterium]